MKRETTTGPTPGPWTVGWTGTVGAPHNLGRPCVNTGGCADWVGPEGAEADARLIAAAPDLLAACEAMAHAANLVYIERIDAMNDAAGLARAAIARATGGAGPTT